MLTDDEARKLQRTLTDHDLRALQRRMSHALNAATGVSAKCAAGLIAAGLIVVTALALFGSRLDLQRTVSGGDVTAAEQNVVADSQTTSIPALEEVRGEVSTRTGSSAQKQGMQRDSTAAFTGGRTAEVDEPTWHVRESD